MNLFRKYVPLLLLIAVSAPAAAQIVAAVETSSTHHADLSLIADAVFPDVAAAVADAKSRASITGRHYEVWIAPNESGSWNLTAPIQIDADDDISLRGFPSAEPWTVILDGSAVLPVIELNGAPETTVIEGLTLTGGSAGILATLSASAIVNRCYIRDNTDGIRSDNAGLIILNCSIVDNDESGIKLSLGGSTTILYCSLIDNGYNGVFAQGGSSATVTNTLVFRNGSDVAGSNLGGLVRTGAGSITPDTNDVYQNDTGGGNDYVGVTADFASISADPLLLTTGALWKGQIDQAQNPPSPVIDAGATPADDIGGLALTDLELQTRPFDFIDVSGTPPGAIPDIGADEVGAEDSVEINWYYCLVTPSPAGELAVGEMTVEVRIIIPQNAQILSVFLVPQGGDVLDPQDRIPVSLDVAATGIVVGRNAIPIETILRDENPTGLSPTDLIADGHAAVYVAVDLVGTTEIVGDDYTSPFFDLGSIRGQALIGRHVLIDTIAPEMDIADPNGDGAGSFITYLTPPAQLGSQAAFANGFIHPYSASLPGYYRPDNLQFAVDDGLILPQPTLTGNGAQAFFNAGSISNNYTRPTPLDIDIHVRFEDFPPTDENGVEIVGLDPFTGQIDRQVAGFDVTYAGSPSPDTVDEILLNGPVVRWLFDEGQNKLAGVTVQDSYVNPSVPNPGFNYTNPSSTITDPQNKAIDVSWRFFDSTGSVAGIPYTNAFNNAPFHFSVRFYAKDPTADDNVPPPDEQELLDPLHVWWLLQSDTIISPPREGATVTQPLFTWQPDRGFNTRSAGQLKPIYSFRVWQSTLPGNDATAYNAVYSPVTPWSAWSDTITILAPTFFENLVNTAALLPNRWVLLAVATADEAGNVEAFPTPEADFADAILGTAELQLDDVTAQNLAVLQPSGRSWVRFFYPGPGPVLETQAIGFYWHDRVPINDVIDANEVTFGSAALVPLPQDPNEQASARFRVVMSASDPTVLPGAGIIWSLKGSDGYYSGENTRVDTDGDNVIDIPFGGPLGDLTNVPPKPVTYVFTAATVAGTNRDQTPATVTFTVVPRSVGAFVDPKDSPDDQPIKIQEGL